MGSTGTLDKGLVLERLPCGVFTYRLEGDTRELLYANAQLPALLGVPTDVDAAQWLRNIPPDELERVRRASEAAVRSGQSHFCDTVEVIRDGHRSWLEVSVQFAPDGHGGTIAYGICAAPPSRPTSTPSLAPHGHGQGASLERLPLQSEILPVGLVITDASEALIITEWNRAAERIFGYSRAEAVGQSSYSLIAADTMRDAMRDHARRSIRPEGVAGSRTQNRTKDGQSIWCEWFNTPLRDASGAVIGVIGMVQDITERLRAEERSRLWTSVLEQSAEGIMICDAEQRILLVNAAFERLTGFSEAEALGKKPNLLSSGQHDAAFYEKMWDSLSRTGQWHGEIWNTRRDGRRFVEWLSISAVRNELGAITHYVGIFSDITQRKQTEERVEHLAHFDALTDLPNRAQLIERVEESLANARRKRDKLALLFIDLDRFKNINDSMGHEAGDQLLKSVSERLRSCVRASDLVARMGGDEFVVALPQIDSARDPAIVADKLLAVLRQPLTLCDQELSISASIGICLFPDDAADVGQLIRNADAAMYHAKSAGRSGYCFYTRDMNERALETLATENALRSAMSREEFLLHYQPQIDLITGALVGAEALIRWRRPGRGLVMPGGFIPVAEERGLIAAIDGWVLQETCRQAAAWSAAGLSVPRLSVNVSATEFHQPGFVERVEAALQQHRVPASRLELELTESIVMRDSQATIAILRRLHEIGVYLAIDDFGTGYSSLNYLRRFPIQKIKVDQSFIREMLLDAGAAGIVRGIIALAKSLKLAIIAEGVETLEQVEHLRAEGCDIAQGFVFSRGISADEFAALLRGWKPSFRPSAPSPAFAGALQTASTGPDRPRRP